MSARPGSGDGAGAPEVFILAGEASGDTAGAGLVEALREMKPDVRFWAEERARDPVLPVKFEQQPSIEVRVRECSLHLGNPICHRQQCFSAHANTPSFMIMNPSLHHGTAEDR